MQLTFGFLRVYGRALITTTIVASVFTLTGTLTHASDLGSDDFRASETVYYGDLDLHVPAGLAALYQRIVAAATLVCDGEFAHQSLAEWSAFRTCKADAVHRAVMSVPNHDLAALVARRNVRPTVRVRSD